MDKVNAAQHAANRTPGSPTKTNSSSAESKYSGKSVLLS